MPRDGTLQTRGQRALDLLNFFVADVQTGFGPFVAVYLTMHKWTQVQIGFALTLSTIVALISQLPAGALVDAAPNKRRAAGGALIGVIVAALLMAFWPSELPVLVAQVLHAFSSCVLTPAIAAISLHLVGHAALGERLGRNARFAAIGNGLAAAVMGVTGTYVSSQSVFLLTAALCVPALLALLAIGRGPHARQQTTTAAVRLARAAAIVHQSATAGVRRLRAAVPYVECRDAAVARRRRDDAHGHLRQPDHRRLHRGAASGRGTLLALGRTQCGVAGPAPGVAAGLGGAASARTAAGGVARRVAAGSSTGP